MTDVVKVDTAHGPVEGVDESGVHAFRGIPYAAPPVGPLRFRPPEPPQPWTEPRPAREFGPQAPQNLSNLLAAFGLDTPVIDEDCLTINVWSPDVSGPPKPVMVWIHGGAFIQGSAGMGLFEGAPFARDGVVLVSMNYRLGALGWLRLPSAVNLGLEDQLFALEWVRDNVAAFGGDPDDVTIFGESAGAISVGAHLVWPAARGLFRRAVLQSGALQNSLTVPAAEEVARRVLSLCSLDSSVADLLAAQKEIGEVNAEDATLSFGPVYDGTALPVDPIGALASGSAAGVDVLIGSTRDELTLTALSDPNGMVSSREAALSRMAPVLGSRAEDVYGAYADARPGAPPADVYCAVATDRFCRIPAIQLAEAHGRAGGTVHMFEFAWPTPAFGGMLRACHGLDVPFVFDSLDDPMARLLTAEVGPRDLASQMHAAWVEFAKTGDPGWPAYDEQNRTTMVFDDPSGTVDDLRRDERLLWPPAAG